MSKKIVLIILIPIIVGFVGLFFYDPNSLDKETLAQTFYLKAIYHENEGLVEVSFEDKSNKTNSVVLEILGMKESFQKTYDRPNFNEIVSFPSKPKYGWKVHPVTLAIDHEEFGKIGLKTEIHSPKEPVPPTIYSKL